MRAGIWEAAEDWQSWSEAVRMGLEKVSGARTGASGGATEVLFSKHVMCGDWLQ